MTKSSIRSYVKEVPDQVVRCVSILNWPVPSMSVIKKLWSLVAKTILTKVLVFHEHLVKPLFQWRRRLTKSGTMHSFVIFI